MREFKVGDRYTQHTRITDRYFTDISSLPMITHEEEARIAFRAREGDQRAIDELVKANLRFVISVAKMYSRGSSTVFEDLISEGNLGLIEAAHAFDPTTGFKFISYAVFHVRKNMIIYLSGPYSQIRIPSNKVQSILKMSKIESYLTQTLDREPTRDELIDEYLKDPKHQNERFEPLYSASLADQPISFLDAPVGRDSDATFADVVAVDHVTADWSIIRSEEERRVDSTLSILSPIDSKIVRLRTGIETGECLSFVDISKEVGMSPGRARTAYNKSIMRLRYSLS